MPARAARAKPAGVLDGLEERADQPTARSRCIHPTCTRRVRIEDGKPDAGWGVVVLRRYGKLRARVSTFYVCPEHALSSEGRQTTLL